MERGGFYDEYLVASPVRAGRHSGKIDFLICTDTGIDEPELPVEAKPLVVESDITRRYLAGEGIGCFFTTDSPHTRGPLGAMLAYTLNRDGRSWKAEIRAAINSYVPPVPGVDALIHGDSEPTTFSRHERLALDLDPIAILHLEMLFELEETPAEQASD